MALAAYAVQAGVDRHRGPPASADSFRRDACANICSCAGIADRRARTPRAGSRATRRRVVRRFDAPEALNTRFHEVHAKSALNQVPGRRAVPFSWTVNPYRGCTHACSYCFARPTHEYLDLNAARGLRARDRRQGQRARGAAGGAGAAVVEGRAVALGTNTDPYQWVEGRYKLMRGIWEALRDVAQPVLDPDQVAAAAARPGPAEGDRRRSRTSARACRCRRSTRRRGGRPSRTRRTRGRGWRRWRELNRAGIPTGDPDRAADAGHQRRARAGGARSSSWRPRPARPRSAAARCSCAARCARSSSTGCASTGRTWCRATRSSTAAAPTCPSRERREIERRGGRRRGAGRGYQQRCEAPGARAAAATLEREARERAAGRGRSAERRARPAGGAVLGAGCSG